MRAISVSIFLLLMPVVGLAESWSEHMGLNSFWVKHSRFADVPEDTERAFDYSALRFNRENFVYQIHEMDDILRDAYEDLSPDYVTLDAGTEQSRVVTPSIEEAWQFLSSDPDVIALIPFGFSEVAGEARLAGLRKEDGQMTQGVFAAPNLNAVFCFDDIDEHRKRTGRGWGPYNGQIPFLFTITYQQSANYRYQEGLDFVDLASGANPTRFAETFDSCNDMVQVGYRVIEPRLVETDSDSEGRISNGRATLSAERPFQRIVMLYDRFGYLNFVKSSEATFLYDFGRLLSSDEYYDSEACAFPETRTSGFRSLSCELWAVSVHAFDPTAIAIRSANDRGVDYWGDPTTPVAGVLTIRKSDYVQPRLEDVDQTTSSSEIE